MIRLSIGCFFFKQKTAYEMRISDWSSDVCSSDLILDQRLGRARRWQRVNPVHHGTICRPRYVEVAADALDEYRDQYDHEDRKSVVSGKSVSVRVDIGGRRIIKKQSQYDRIST